MTRTIKCICEHSRPKGDCEICELQEENRKLTQVLKDNFFRECDKCGWWSPDNHVCHNCGNDPSVEGSKDEEI